MKAKKVLAVALAAAMAFSALPGMSVKADEIVGGTVYVNQDVIDVTLPTTASQKFYIDPQGLIAIGLASGAATATNQGTVIGKSEMYAVNNSSMPLAFTVSYKLVDSASGSGVTIATGVAADSDIEAIQKATEKKIAVSVSAQQTASGPAATCNGYVFKAGDDGLVSGQGVDMTASSSATQLASPEAVYAVASGSATGGMETYFMTAQTYKAQLKTGKTDAYDSNSYEYVVDSTANKASCVKLTIGGYCSTKADWSAYAKGTETLNLEVTFKFKKLTKVDGSETNYYLATDAEDAQSAYLAKTTVAKGTTETIALSMPAGVTYQSAKLKLGTAEYDMNTSQISVSGTTMTIVAGNSWGGGTITVTFSNNHSETITVEN